MPPVSYINTHHDVIDLINHEMVKNTKTWISQEWNIIFLWNKEILSLCFRWDILRSYCFEVTFKTQWRCSWEKVVLKIAVLKVDRWNWQILFQKFLLPCKIPMKKFSHSKVADSKPSALLKMIFVIYIFQNFKPKISEQLISGAPFTVGYFVLVLLTWRCFKCF